MYHGTATPGTPDPGGGHVEDFVENVGCACAVEAECFGSLSPDQTAYLVQLAEWHEMERNNVTVRACASVRLHAVNLTGACGRVAVYRASPVDSGSTPH